MTIHVHLAGSNRALHDRCLEALADEAYRATTDDEPSTCDVLILLSPDSSPESSMPVATIGLTPTAPADSLLPADFTPRELQLACQLAARLTAARRALQEARVTEGHLRTAVETDPLTGLANRRWWEAARLQYMGQCLLHEQPLTLAILDLDHFKQVNSQQGYAAGDRVLTAVGGALAQAVRRDDLVARFGGDEFGLLLPQLAADQAGEVVQRIRLAVSSLAVGTPLTASAGYASMSGSEHTDAATINAAAFDQADQALRQAKAAGGDRTVGAS